MNEAADHFEPSHTIAYLDPPYVEKSARLYKTGFSKRFENPDRWEGLNEHEELAAYLRTTATIRWILSYDDHPALLSSETLYANALTTADARTLIQVRPANDIVLRRIELQHSASSQKKRHQVPELVLTTLAESDCEGVGDPIWAQRSASSSTPD
jgi:DNA adenine methylase